MRIHKGDTVQIISGKDRGKTGKVIKINGKNQTVTVEGVNLYKKHSRPKKQGEKGEIVTIVRPLAYDKVMLYCSNCKKGQRIGFKAENDGRKSRFCRRCGAAI